MAFNEVIPGLWLFLATVYLWLDKTLDKSALLLALFSFLRLFHVAIPRLPAVRLLSSGAVLARKVGGFIFLLRELFGEEQAEKDRDCLSLSASILCITTVC